MCFSFKFVISVRERTFVEEFALAEQFPIAAHLSLELHLVLLNESVALAFTLECFLWLFASSLL